MYNIYPMIVTDLYVQSVVCLQWMSDKHHVAAVYVIISSVTGTYTTPYNSTIQYISYVSYRCICSDCGLPAVDFRQALCCCIVCGRCYNILSDRYVMPYQHSIFSHEVHTDTNCTLSHNLIIHKVLA